METKEVFICYRGNNQEAVSIGAQIHTLLEYSKNIRCFYAPYSIAKGEDFKNILPNIFKKVKVVVLLLSENFFNNCFHDDDIVFTELREALKNKKIKFLPVKFKNFNYCNENLSLFNENEIDRFKHINAFEYYTAYAFDFDKLIKVICELKGDYIDSDHANRLLMKVINRALGEGADVKLEKRTFSGHKTNPNAQESRLIGGDTFEIMTNSLTYDLDMDSIEMIAISLSNGVKYYYYLEQNKKTKKELTKFINGIYFVLGKSFSPEQINAFLYNNLFVYWLPENTYPYSFTLINRPLAFTIDNCSLYFVKKEDQLYLYEVLLNEEQELVDALKTVFKTFKINLKRVELNNNE